MEIAKAAHSDLRAQVLANCKFLYGANTDVLTLSSDDRHQAVAIKYDSLTGSVTKLLHARPDALSTNEATQWLLEETESQITNQLCMNRVSIPFLGAFAQTMKIQHGAHSYSNVCGAARSEDFELITTSGSSLAGVTVAEKENPVKKYQHEPENKGSRGEIQDQHTIDVCPVHGPTPEVLFEDNSLGVGTGPVPEAEIVFATEPAREAEPEVAIDHYNTWSAEEKLVPEVERVLKPLAFNYHKWVAQNNAFDAKPVPGPDPDREIAFDDDFWDAPRNDKEKRGTAVVEESSHEPLPEAAVENYLGWGTASSPRKDKKKRENPRIFDFYEHKRSQTQDQQCGYTVILKILFHSINSNDQSMQVMVTLADNTLKAIYNAANSHIDSRIKLAGKRGRRKLEVIYAAGKNGDLSLSGLKQSKWPEYLEYFSKCTGFPELTVDVSDVSDVSDDYGW